MYNIRPKLNKKVLFTIIAAILVAIAALYFLLFDEESGEIPTLYPLVANYKTAANSQQDLLSSENEGNIYENFTAPNSKKAKLIKLLPEPEAPILLQQNSELSHDIFSDELVIAHAPNDAVSHKAQKIITKEQGEDSIWENIEEATGKLDLGQPEAEKSQILEVKALKVTSLSEKKQVPRIFNQKIQTSFYVQLAYSRSQSELISQWNKIKNNNKKVLANFNYKIEKQKNEKLVSYELLIGPFSQFKEAKQLCTRIKLDKHKCLVVKK